MATIESSIGEASIGTRTMLGLALRRDRWLLPVAIVGFAAMAGFSASATADLYPEPGQRVSAADVVNSTPSLVALYGRIYDPTSLGSIALFKLAAFGAALVAILMAALVVRHTRAEEEAGRLELVGSGKVSRAAPLTAAVVVALGASVVLGAATSVALTLGGLPLPGSVAFGLSWAAAGMVFAAVAAIASQVASSRRNAIGLSVGAVALAYALRAIGDIPESGPTLLTWLSPIGWSQQVRAFAGDRWWVLLLPLTFTFLLVAIAFALRSHRDLGAGILQDRPGRANGKLEGVWSLAVRLNRGVFFAWAVAFVGFGLLLGSLASNATGMLDSDAMREIVTQLGGEQHLVDAFIAAELGILGAIVAAFGIAATSHIRSEESVGHAELLLARATPRWRWVSSHFGLAIGGVALLMFLGGLAIGVGAVLDVGSASMMRRVLLAAMATIPAAWVITAIALALAGTAPRFISAAWGIFIVAVVLGEFGSLWAAPQWLVNLSPFVHTPKMPVDGSDVLPLAVLTGVAAALTCLGYAGLQRRDIG